MKVTYFIAVLVLAPVLATSASAQAVQNSGFAGHDMINTGAPIGSTTAGDTRLGGSRQERVDALIYKDRQAIKELKKQLKAAQTDEERSNIKEQIQTLQQDIVNIQQQG